MTCSCHTYTQEYMEFFKNCRYTDENNDTYVFELVYAVNSRTYISLKGIPTVMYYLWKKTKVGDKPSITDSERVLNEVLYSEGGLQVYDKVIGDGFTTPGGLTAAKVSGRGFIVMATSQIVTGDLA